MQIERCELKEVHVVFFRLSSDNTTDHVPNSRNTPQVHLRLMLRKITLLLLQDGFRLSQPFALSLLVTFCQPSLR